MLPAALSTAARRLERAAPRWIEAADLEQCARIALWHHADRVRGHPNPGGAAVTIGRRAMIDALRSAGQHEAPLPAVLDMPAAPPWEPLHERNMLRRLQPFARTPEGGRIIAMLLRGTTQANIARAVGQSEGWIARTVKRAKEALDA